MPTHATAASPLRLRTGLLTAYREDLQRWVVVDRDESAVWHVSESTIALVRALGAGWNPLGELRDAHASMPATLRETLQATDVPEDGWVALCRDTLAPLREAGLLVGEDGPTDAPARGRTRMRRALAWAHRMAHYQWPGGTVPAIWSRTALLTRSPQLLLTCLAAVSLWMLIWWRLINPLPTGLLATLSAQMPAVPFQYPGMAGWLILLLVARTTVHELGHALFTSSLTGHPTEVGIRLLWGLPRAYTDASTSALVPTRSARLLVLLGGVTADALVGLGLVAVLAATGSLPVPLLHFLKYVLTSTILTNLVPLFRSDGYFILGELTGRARLRDDALDALTDAVHDTSGDTAGNTAEDAALMQGDGLPGWLMWYGVAHVSVLCLGIGLAAALLPRLLPNPERAITVYSPLVTPIAVTLAVVALWWHSHRTAQPAPLHSATP